jgi:hypothetical protein
MKGFSRVLRKLGSLTNTDYTVYRVGTRARFTDVYNKYEEKYGAVRLRRIVPPNLSRKKRAAWDEIYDDGGGGGSASGIHPLAGTLNMSRDTSATALLQAASSLESNASELISYLDCDTVSQLDDDFNLLSWWHQHKLTYPVLSTICPETTFSMTGRIIEEWRRKLSLRWWRCSLASKTGRLQRQGCNTMWRTRSLKTHLKNFILISVLVIIYVIGL